MSVHGHVSNARRISSRFRFRRAPFFAPLRLCVRISDLSNTRHVQMRAALIAALLLMTGVVQAQTPTAAPPASKGGPAQPSLYKAEPGPYAVEHRDVTWRDEARKRDVPVRIYTPERAGTNDASAARLPVIVFSHGLGGSREGYAYFAEHMAGYGYIVILPSHAGSDRAALRDWIRDQRDRAGDQAGEEGRREERRAGAGWLRAGISDPDNLRNRPRDVSFIIDQLGNDEQLAAAADMDRIGVAGHSFGAYTMMAVAGMLVDLPEGNDASFRDARVKAAVAMSPQGAGTMGVDEDAWANVAVPVLFLTGTRDYGSGGRAAAWRREAFDHMQGAGDAYLAILQDATHSTFSGRVRARDDGGDRPTEAERAGHARLILALSTAFFDAYLREDEAARDWLRTYAAATHEECAAAFRPAGAAALEPAAADGAGAELTVTIDASAAPDLQTWGDKAGELCRTWYPIIAAELASDGFTPPAAVTIRFRESMRVPAATGGGTIHVNAAYVQRHMDDLGMIVHELTHLVQAYPNHPKRTPGWIVEGIADYVRFYKYEPGADHSRIDPERSNYDDSYRTTARFLDYLVRTRDPNVVSKLNAAARAGECDEAKAAEIFGADPAELWRQFLAAEVAEPDS